MKIQKNSPDRRKDKRFKLKDPVFALMYFSPTMMGRVTDISRSGAAVRYVKSGDGYRELNQLDIFKSDFKLYIENLKAKTISDMEIIDKTFIGSKEIRRCGIQFEDLTDIQISQLKDFIQNFAILGKQ